MALNDKLTPGEVLACGRLIAGKVMPYFRAAMVGLVPRQMAGLGTVGVSANGILVWDPVAVGKWTPKQMAGVWVHEVMHLFLRHPHRRGDRDPELWNRAGDLFINPGILEGLELPPLDYEMPQKHGWDVGLSADEYYRLLQEERKEQEKAGKGGTPKLGGGGCGGCAGNPHAHEDPNDPAGKTPAQIARIGRGIAEGMANAAQTGGKAAGMVPGAWLREALAVLEPPRVPWQQKLGRAVRTAVSFTSGHTLYRWDGPSRRQGGLGYGPGRPVMPRLRAPVPRVAVVVDTSGSMGPDEMKEALRETRGVLRACNAKVEFCACDAEVHSLAKITRIEDAFKLLKGGGGTDFRPAFDALLNRRAERPHVIVFVTDGFGPAPDVSPPGVHTIWLLVGRHTTTPATWGEVITMNEKKEEAAA